MLNVEYKLRIGQDEFLIKAEVENEKEFFETLSFYSSLPKTGPGGETDLRLSFRTTTQGHKYYSLVSEKAKMEFKLGQNLENRGNGLFPKGWEPLYQKDNDGNDVATASAAPIGAPVQQAARPAAAPIVQPTPQAAPVQQAAPAQQAPAPQAAPVQQAPAAPTQAAPAAPANPAVNQVANSVLARFGIKAPQPQA